MLNQDIITNFFSSHCIACRYNRSKQKAELQGSLEEIALISKEMIEKL